MLSGMKTYIIGGVMIIAGITKMFFPDFPLDVNGPTVIMEGLAFMGLRAGVAKIAG